MKRESCAGFTLIELLITIAVSTILIGVVLFTLQTSLDTYHYVQDELFLQKILDETLQVISDGDFEQYGIKDSLEILHAGTNSITFAPLWVDEGHRIKETVAGKQTFVLKCPFKAGASLPIGEILIKQKKIYYWKQYPIVFYLNEQDDPKKSNAYVAFYTDVPLAAEARFIYRPDTTHYPDSAMTIQYQDNGILRIYKGKKEKISKYGVLEIKVTDVRFQYFDNTNSEIVPDASTGIIQAAQILNITAIKISMQVAKDGVSRERSVFINLRNAFASGAGFILREGTQITVPDSDNIRTLSLLNIVGAQNKGKIILEAQSEKGKTWTIHMELGGGNEKRVIHRYSIEYPSGQTVYSETIDLPVDQSLNFLTLGTTGRYDYDTDENVDDVVNLKGKIKLTVNKMDAAGAALLVRP